jgi:hypothetical protein
MELIAVQNSLLENLKPLDLLHDKSHIETFMQPTESFLK